MAEWEEQLALHRFPNAWDSSMGDIPCTTLHFHQWRVIPFGKKTFNFNTKFLFFCFFLGANQENMGG